ncbi:Ribosome biogenesis protein 1 [Balamuthia mandrillaris]
MKTGQGSGKAARGKKKNYDKKQGVLLPAEEEELISQQKQQQHSRKRKQKAEEEAPPEAEEPALLKEDAVLGEDEGDLSSDEGEFFREVTAEQWFNGGAEEEEAEDVFAEEAEDDQDNAEATSEHGDVESEDEEYSDDEAHERLSEENFQKLRAFLTRDDAPESEESDDETENTIGNVPLEWYKDYDHIGYDQEGRKIMKSQGKDALDRFLDRSDDPNYWRTVYDEYNDKEVVLSKKDLLMIRRMKEGKFPDPSFDPYAPWEESDEPPRIHPLTNKPEPKSRFLPSKWEAKRVAYLVKAIKKGWLKIGKDAKTKEAPRFYDIWATPNEEAEKMKRTLQHLPPPKLKMPGHDESYNPPEEYLPSESEIKAWEDLDPEDRPKNYLPQKFDALRHVPAYSRFIHERFERCLDLYLVPRVADTRVKVDPKTILPTLPKREDLRPFPVRLGLVFEGHTAKIRSISVSPSGEYIVSGSDDCTVRVWEVSTGRCYRKWKVGSVVHAVAWNPNPDVDIIAVAVEDNKVLLMNAETGSAERWEKTQSVLRLSEEKQEKGKTAGPKRGKRKGGLHPAIWRWPHEEELLESEEEDDEHKEGEAEGDATAKEEKEAQKKAEALGRDVSKIDKRISLVLSFTHAVNRLTWHRKGDYLATVAPMAAKDSILIHQLSKKRTQNPFKRTKGQVQDVAFHPTKPFFFVATQRYVRVYDLLKQQLAKKLMPGVKWIASIEVHPKGDNILVSSYDRRLCWFDLDLSNKPYKVLRHHRRAVRQGCFHPAAGSRYPLFASCSDDGFVYVFHGMVYDDLMQNPLIVPLKRLKAMTQQETAQNEGLGVLDCVFHPKQPWLFCAGADACVQLWTP